MLQQTRVETVRPRYCAFLAAFPDPAALASASEEAVLAHWSGLGYYSRARLLRRGASVVAEKHEGVFPREFEAARAIPGIGHYTCAAILSIAFNLPHAVVDGNVARVLARLYRLEPPKDRPGAESRDLAQVLLDPARPGDHNQAMMELGALICTPARPNCAHCPVGDFCEARRAGVVDRYPAPKPRPVPVQVQGQLYLLRDARGRLLLEKGRWPLLPGLWIPPIRDGAVDAPGSLPARFRIEPGSLSELGGFSHSITKHRVRLRVRGGRLSPGAGTLPSEFRLVSEEELAGLGRSSIVEKALRLESAPET
jgi:A/G-specific adenine glycosylase